MKAILRGLGILVLFLAALVVALFLVVVNFTATDSTFRCDGEITAKGETKPATLFMKLTKYRWWTWWTATDGMVTIEAPKVGLPYEPFLGLKKITDSTVQIFEDSSHTALKGMYYDLSKTLSLDTHQGFFDGTCVPLND